MSFYPINSIYANWTQRVPVNNMETLDRENVVLTTIEGSESTNEHLLVQTKDNKIFVFVGPKGIGDAKTVLENLLTNDCVEMPAKVRVAAIELSRAS